MQRPGESLTVDQLRVLETQAYVAPAEDVDLDAWLTEQAGAGGKFGHVDIDGKRIKIAPVTEGEENRLLKASRRPNPQSPKEQKIDMLVYRRAYIAFSLSKANGMTITSEDQRILNMLPGILTRIFTAIQELSKYELPEHKIDPFESLI